MFLFTYIFRNVLLLKFSNKLCCSWDTDQGMGQQMLTSAASFMFKECKEIPDHFKVTDEDVKDLLGGETIDSQIAVIFFILIKTISFKFLLVFIIILLYYVILYFIKLFYIQIVFDYFLKS